MSRVLACLLLIASLGLLSAAASCEDGALTPPEELPTQPDAQAPQPPAPRPQEEPEPPEPGPALRELRVCVRTPHCAAGAQGLLRVQAQASGTPQLVRCVTTLRLGDQVLFKGLSGVRDARNCRRIQTVIDYETKREVKIYAPPNPMPPGPRTPWTLRSESPLTASPDSETCFDVSLLDTREDAHPVVKDSELQACAQAAASQPGAADCRIVVEASYAFAAEQWSQPDLSLEIEGKVLKPRLSDGRVSFDCGA